MKSASPSLLTTLSNNTSIKVFFVGIRRKLLSSVFFIAPFVGFCQTIDSRVFENGGGGNYKAVIIKDSTLNGFTILRPKNLEAAVIKEGKLPVVLFANGGCANSNLLFDGFLNEIASHGYIAIAIGPMEHGDAYKTWEERLMQGDGPKKRPAVVGNGTIIDSEEVKKKPAQKTDYSKLSVEELEKLKKQFKPTSGTMLLDALDWLTKQNSTLTSEYYHKVDLVKVAAMGQSCGGAQALSISYDPRITTSVILNSGMGNMKMANADSESLKELHAPIVYLIGGQEDVAYLNAEKDYKLISNVPIAKANLDVGHLGTYYEKNGGSFAVIALKWLNWQLKGKIGESAFFLDEDYLKIYPGWGVESKNFY